MKINSSRSDTTGRTAESLRYIKVPSNRNNKKSAAQEKCRPQATTPLERDAIIVYWDVGQTIKHYMEKYIRIIRIVRKRIQFPHGASKLCFNMRFAFF